MSLESESMCVRFIMSEDFINFSFNFLCYATFVDFSHFPGIFGNVRQTN